MTDVSETTEASLEYLPVGGVEWCVTHHGIVDECGSGAGECDMADHAGDCDVRELFYLSGFAAANTDAEQGEHRPEEGRI